MRVRGQIWLVLGLCAAVAGCSSSESSNPDAGTNNGNNTQNLGSPDERVGGFDVQLVAPVAATGGSSGTPGLTRIVGRVQTSSKPEAVVLEVDRQVGECQLRTPRVPFCEKKCEDGVCVEDDVCKPNPDAVSLGTVTVSGLKSSANGDIALVAVQNNYQAPGSVKVEYPPADEGAPIRFQTTGAQFPPFTIEGRGIAPLELPANARYPLQTGKSLDLTWTPPTVAGVSKIHIKMDISHHGGSKGQIDCDVDDDGAYSVDASLVERLVGLGVAGFPTVVLTRSAVTELPTAAGRVDLEVYMYQERAVEIPGLISCTEDTECPSGDCKPDQSCAAQQ